MRALHRCIFTVGSDACRPSLVMEESEEETTEEEKEEGLGDTKRVEQLVDIDPLTLTSEIELLTPFIPQLVGLLKESVKERSTKPGLDGAVRLADVTKQVSPELCLLHKMITEGGAAVSVECVLNGAIGVLGQALSAMDAAMTVDAQGASDSQGQQLLLQRNTVMACECVVALLTVSVDVNADARLKNVHDQVSSSCATDAGILAGSEDTPDVTDEGAEGTDDGNNVQVEEDEPFPMAAVTCASAMGGLLTTLMLINNKNNSAATTTSGDEEAKNTENSAGETKVIMATTSSVMRACFDLATLTSQYEYSESLRPAMCDRGCLPPLRRALQIPTLANDAEKVLHALWYVFVTKRIKKKTYRYRSTILLLTHHHQLHLNLSNHFSFLFLFSIYGVFISYYFLLFLFSSV